VNVWKNTTSSDCGISEKFVKFFVVSDSELNVSWDNSALFVIFSGVSCKLKDLGGEVLKDGCKVDWGSSSYSLGVSSNLKESGDSSDWELKSSSSGS
jgi:hypothetical protein